MKTSLKGADLIATQHENGGATKVAAGGRAKPRKPRNEISCERCYFGCHDLCALNLGGPCSTFRPDGPEGLVPPRQPALLVREPALATSAA